MTEKSPIQLVVLKSDGHVVIQAGSAQSLIQKLIKRGAIVGGTLIISLDGSEIGLDAIKAFLGDFNETQIKNLKRRVDEFTLSVRTRNCCSNMGAEYIWQLAERNEEELMRTKNFGKKSLNEVNELLNDLDLSLDMSVSLIRDLLA